MGMCFIGEGAGCFSKHLRHTSLNAWGAHAKHTHAVAAACSSMHDSSMRGTYVVQLHGRASWVALATRLEVVPPPPLYAMLAACMQL